MFLPYYNWGDFVGFTWFTGMPLTALEMSLTALEEEIFLFFFGGEANHFQTPGVSFRGAVLCEFLEGSKKQQCKSMIILKDFTFNSGLFGLVSYTDPCYWDLFFQEIFLRSTTVNHHEKTPIW